MALCKPVCAAEVAPDGSWGHLGVYHVSLRADMPREILKVLACSMLAAIW